MTGAPGDPGGEQVAVGHGEGRHEPAVAVAGHADPRAVDVRPLLQPVDRRPRCPPVPGRRAACRPSTPRPPPCRWRCGGRSRKTMKPSRARAWSQIRPPAHESTIVGACGPAVGREPHRVLLARSRSGGRINSPSSVNPSRAAIWTRSRGPKRYESRCDRVRVDHADQATVSRVEARPASAFRCRTDSRCRACRRG